MDAITDKNRVRYLTRFLDFLATWEERPACLTPMAYEWCSAISEVAEGLGQGSMGIGEERCLLPLFDLDMELTLVGPGGDLVHPDNNSHARGLPRVQALEECTDLLRKTLKVGFRLAGPGPDQPSPDLNHTSHHDRMFEAVFSCDDDELIADAVGAWIVGSSRPTGSCARYFTKRIARATPLLPRLRQAGIRALEHNWRSELTMSIPDTVCLLNRLNVDVDDVEDKYQWSRLLEELICSPTGFESLPSHYWCLLGKLTWERLPVERLGPRDVEVMKLLEVVENWEKLEVCMATVWSTILSFPSMPESMGDVERVTLKLISQRPQALQRFENLCKRKIRGSEASTALELILDRVQAGQSPLESPPPP